MKAKGTVFFKTAMLASVLYQCKTTENPAVAVDEFRKEAVVYASEDSNSSQRAIKDQYDSSIKDTHELLAKNQSDTKLLSNLAELYLLKGDLKSAEVYAKKTLANKFKDQRAQLTLAHVYYRRGQFDMSRVILGNLESLGSKNSEIQNLLGLIEYKLGNKSSALAFFKKGLTLNSDDISIRMNLGSLYYEFRQLNLAATQFERILLKLPDHTDARLDLAAVKVARNDKVGAQKELEMVLDKDNSNLLAMYNYSYLLYAQKDYDRSAEYLKKYINGIKDDSKQLEAAFALADRIKSAQTSKKSISDEEITSLSKRLATSKTTQPNTATLTKSTSDSDTLIEGSLISQVSEVEESEPASNQQKAQVKRASEDISDLEQILAK